MAELNWQNILFRIIFEVALALVFLFIAFVVWLLLRKLGLVRGSFGEAWLRWVERSESLSHSVFLVRLIVVVLALFVFWDSR